MYRRRDDRRKTRADNFSEEDKNLLLSLIAEHIPILENRRTDHRNNSAKYKAWATISKRFHRQATHPRNFTQMKDLYRRLKLKAKKEVGLWLKICTESGTSSLPPGCELTPPDDTSFLIYEMIKPYKEDLHANDEERDCLLAEELKKSSSNSPYTSQDLNASGSYSTCQQHGPAEAGSNSSNKYSRQPTDGCRSLERKLEREREKRTHGEPLPSRLDPKVFPEESSPPMTDLRRNGFRLASSSTTTRVPDNGTNSGPYQTTSNRDALASMGSLTVASTPSSAALRGHSIGFGSRDASAAKSPTQRNKTFRSGVITPINDKLRNSRYPFMDPVHSASPSFQQRLSELAALESDTIRYERTKRIKKRSKQENQ